MFQTGEMVMYGGSGVCEVVGVGPIEAGFADVGRSYYTLRPVYSSETIYAPVDTGVFMRLAMTHVEAHELIKQILCVEGTACTNRSPASLREHYELSFQSHECEDLAQLIKDIYAKNQSAQQNGRRLSQVDQRYMKRAEDLLYGELAVALGIERTAVVSYIDQMAEQPQ